MPDPATIFGVPIIIILWAMVKCGIEVNGSDIDDPAEENKLYWQCIIDAIIPSGLPDPDRFDDSE